MLCSTLASTQSPPPSPPATSSMGSFQARKLMCEGMLTVSSSSMAHVLVHKIQALHAPEIPIHILPSCHLLGSFQASMHIHIQCKALIMEACNYLAPVCGSRYNKMQALQVEIPRHPVQCGPTLAHSPGEFLPTLPLLPLAGVVGFQHNVQC